MAGDDSIQTVKIEKSILFVVVLLGIALVSYLLSYIVASDALDMVQQEGFVTAFEVVIPLMAILFGAYYFYDAKVRKSWLEFGAEALYDWASRKRLGRINYSEIKKILVYRFAGMSTFAIEFKDGGALLVKGMAVSSKQQKAMPEKFHNIRFVK